jgi:hypothetical protein
MKTAFKSLLLTGLLVGVCQAQDMYPNDNVSFQSRDHYDPVTINWHVVGDILQACNTLHFGKAKYNGNIAACAIRTGNQCDIYTQQNLDLAVLGHEVRHCYEGHWHE